MGSCFWFQLCSFGQVFSLVLSGYICKMGVAVIAPPETLKPLWLKNVLDFSEFWQHTYVLQGPIPCRFAVF